MKKILIAEDDRSLLMGLEKALSGSGFAVDTAALLSTAKEKMNHLCLV